jgi:hypothetical protein
VKAVGVLEEMDSSLVTVDYHGRDVAAISRQGARG